MTTNCQNFGQPLSANWAQILLKLWKSRGARFANRWKPWERAWSARNARLRLRSLFRPCDCPECQH